MPIRATPESWSPAIEMRDTLVGDGQQQQQQQQQQ